MRDLFDDQDHDDRPSLDRAWASALERLRIDAPAAWYERFLQPIRPISLIDGKVTLGTPGKFIHDWVRARYLAPIETALGDELGFAVVVELKSESRERPKAPTTSLAAPVVVDDARFSPNDRFTFDSFVIGISNRLAYAGAKAVAEEPGRKYNPLFIYGPSGLGKTHLLHAIARELLARDPKFPLVYVSAQQFAEEFIQALQSKNLEPFRRSKRNVGVWLVDDIQFIAGKDRTQEEVFHTFNHLQASGRQIVLTSDRPPRDLYLMDERMRSRFEAGLVVDVQMPDTETRYAIVRKKAEREGVALQEDVAWILAEHVPGNIRTLEGALTKLVAHSSLLEQPLTVELANEIVDRHYRGLTHAKPGFDQILDAVGKRFGITINEMKGSSRKAPVVFARHVAIYIAREITGDSWKHIGGLLGDRDHSSIIHGYQKVTELISQDQDVRATVMGLKRNLYPEG